MVKKKLHNAITECFVEVYQNAIPKANFLELLENAPLNSEGKKVINYNDYVIDNEILDSIIEKHIKISKIPKRMRHSFKISIYFGPSPVSLYNK